MQNGTKNFLAHCLVGGNVLYRVSVMIVIVSLLRKMPTIMPSSDFLTAVRVCARGDLICFTTATYLLDPCDHISYSIQGY